MSNSLVVLLLAIPHTIRRCQNKTNWSVDLYCTSATSHRVALAEVVHVAVAVVRDSTSSRNEPTSCSFLLSS